MSTPSRRPTGRVATTRPSTQSVPVQKTPTSKVPPARPPTGKVPTQGGRPTTSRVAPAAAPHRVTTRREVSPRSVPASRKSNTPVLIGAGVGGLVLLIIVIAIAAGGGAKKPSEASNKKKSAAPLDVAGMEREAEAKCNEGLALIQGTESRMTGRALAAGEKLQLKSDLERGMRLISEGNALFEQANAKSGHMYDTVKYGKALKAARMKVGELGGK